MLQSEVDFIDALLPHCKIIIYNKEDEFIDCIQLILKCLLVTNFFEIHLIVNFIQAQLPANQWFPFYVPFQEQIFGEKNRKELSRISDLKSAVR